MRSRAGKRARKRSSPGCRRRATAAERDERSACMNVRKKFRALMSGTRLVLMPAAYDGLSARIIEADGVEALCPGGYAAVAPMLAKAHMGHSSVRGDGDHYARLWGTAEVAAVVRAEAGL